MSFCAKEEPESLIPGSGTSPNRGVLDPAADAQDDKRSEAAPRTKLLVLSAWMVANRARSESVTAGVSL